MPSDRGVRCGRGCRSGRARFHGRPGREISPRPRRGHRDTKDLDKVRAFGADVVIDYRKEDFADVPSGYDVVLDSLGGANLDKSLTILKPGGLAISVVGPPDPAFARQVRRPILAPVLAVLSRKVRRRAKKLGVRYSFLFMPANGAQLKTLAGLDDDGTLRPVLDRTFPFDETIQAMAYVEAGKARGKIVVVH